MPYGTSFPDVDIPKVDLWSFLFDRGSKPFADSKGKTKYTGTVLVRLLLSAANTQTELFTDGETGRTHTYASLRQQSVAFGRGLRARWGFQPRDVLGFYTPNNIDVPLLTCGLLWLGAVASPANPLSTPKELARQLRDSGAKGLVTQAAQLPNARRAAAEAGIPADRIILIGDERRDPEGKAVHFSELLLSGGDGEEEAPPARAAVDPEKDLSFLVYSSGTTGLQKGVCLSHYNIVANIIQMTATDGQYLTPYGGTDGKGDKMLGVTPFFHIYGLSCCLFTGIYLGWQLVVMARFDIERACQLVEKYRLTYAYIPPPVVLAFAKHPAVDKYDLTSLRVLHSGAAPLTAELTEALWQRLRIPVKQGYGLSETSPVTNVQLPDEWAKFMGSVGKLVPNMQAKIVDLEGNEVPEGQEGEFWVKGPNVFLGYLNQPDKTRDTFSPDGWFKTGDIFRRDKHGNYYCVDRLKELIKYKGFQVAPAELEGLLLGHPDVADVGVIGVQDPEQATEVPRAYVVLSPAAAGKAAAASAAAAALDAKAKEIAEWAAGHTAPHKKLRGGVVFVKEVPKSPSGKILRRELRDLAKKEERKTAGARL
ncbi:uncharacterized protein E0L32_003597 [Thyridium curvatum]|uniref:Uncharacterized protein n=1 Tax=Thyridium curvatum TaxID=1093900 RepID=A0A507BBP1_9PEZI|nr:uncharacterized protein E0L32_003597 [Thyridium curvatum]TPX16656.1 hypothetical protein E0L32_003597 [Thyridium curvatum]